MVLDADMVLQTVSVNPLLKLPQILVWFSDEICLIFTLQDFVGRMVKIDERSSIETDFFTLFTPK